MTDSPDYDSTLLAWVTPVVTSLADVVPAEQLMLVGAQCRDLLHWRSCRSVPPRATNDTDIAVALKNWDHFEAIRATFPAVGSTGHRFLIADRAVDVIPFGQVESPTGTTRHPPGNEFMNVHGFTDAYLRADVLPLSGSLTVRIPQPPNYAVLKLHAWLDRSADHNYKDGPDLALAVHWYADDLDRLYDEPHQWALRRHDFDLRRAAGALLGHDMRASVSPPEAGVLATRVTEADHDLLAEHFAVGQPGWPATAATRRPLVDALLGQLTADS
jgi:predicted nucleotidyltransferase